MGSAQSCRLDELSNVCDMHQCIYKVEGRASDSASPTDTWLCTLKRGTTFNDKPCSHVFMKIGINDESKESASLVFECLVYDRLITPMLDGQMCPNFLRSYLLSTECTYADLEKTLIVGVQHLDRAQIATNLHRNLTFMAQRKKDRPAIDKLTPKPTPKPTAETAFVPAVDPNDVPHLFASHRFIVISTEYTNVQSFKEWLQTPDLSSVDRYTVPVANFNRFARNVFGQTEAQ